MKQKGDYDAASALLTRYASIADGTRDKELFAELLADWANAKDVADRRGKLTQAGAEYVKLAVARKQEAEQARYYELAHSAYTAAGDTVKAEDVLKKLSALPGAKPEQLAGLNLKKAQLLLQEQKYTEAGTLLNELSKAPGGLGLRASVKWAFAEVKCGLIQLNEPSTEADGRLRIKDGLRVLTDVANKSYENADEKMAHEEALYNLARFLIDRNLPDVMNLADAEGRFRRLLRDYPRARPPVGPPQPMPPPA
jgi:tetratricopeptide (TPR) repeat protein